MTTVLAENTIDNAQKEAAIMPSPEDKLKAIRYEIQLRLDNMEVLFNEIQEIKSRFIREHM